MIDVIGFDGDDTLWHNESIFAVTQERFHTLLRPFATEEQVRDQLLATETRNLRLFGYGIKGFTLSMVETAVEVSDGRIGGREIQSLIDDGKWMLDHPVELLNGVREVVEPLAHNHGLILITKGDLFDQESKIARSGLGDLFWRIEVVSEKDADTYRRVLSRHDIRPDQFLMVGNSMRSDILPVIEIGARAIYIPYALTWAHEVVERELGLGDGVVTVSSITDLPTAMEHLEALQTTSSPSKP